jgi:hypothetical protein
MWAAGDEDNVAAALEQPATDDASDGARAVDDVSHCSVSLPARFDRMQM